MSPKPWLSLVRSTLALCCLLFPLTLLMLVLHEGGHALDSLAHGEPVTTLYVHPFAFAGYARPGGDWSRVSQHTSGTVVVLAVSLLVFLLLWTRRSRGRMPLANLPLAMLFPWNAIVAGVGVVFIPLRTGDYYNLMQLTGLAGWVFYVPGILLLLLGILLFMSLLPLAGLAPEDGRSFWPIPAAFLLWGLISLPVAYLVVPGSPIDVRYGLAPEMLMTARMNPIMAGVIGVLIGALYVGVYRRIYPRLRASLRSETTVLAWRDLRIPGILAAVSVVVGLIIIT